MCGIAGIVSNRQDRRSLLSPMVEALAHRGPDAEGYTDLEGASLGHRRLSIIDVDGGAQPMMTADGAACVVFNGEIYNFPDLRRELERAGRVFRTRSDTEVLLQLYQRYGDDCVLHLDGMFAFGIWDVARRRLLLARDHLGQKPLFYSQVNDLFLFASEVKAILAAGTVPRELDVAALYDYISLRFLPDASTLFKGVRKLPAAHRLVLERGEVRVERYWRLSFHPKLEGSETEVTDALEARLEATVRDHLLSDVPVGCFLSGGVDSSLITALAARATAGALPTFSIGVAEEDVNELPWARQVATACRTDHHELVARADLIHLVPKMVWHLDEPADPFGVGVYLVSELAAKHVKVALSGDGGDELFAGYDRFAGQMLAERWAILPRTLREGALRKCIDRLPESFAYKGLTQKIRWLNEMSLHSGAERYAESMSFLRFSEAAKQELFTPATHRMLGYRTSQDRILAEFHASDADTLVDRMLYTDLATRMPDHLLAIVDRMAMAHGLEVRPPLLEHRMAHFAARVPSRFKLKGTRLKHILRQVALRHLPRELVLRPKQGFGFPLAQWMRGELAPFLRGLARTSRLVDAGLFESRYVARIIDEHLTGRHDHNFRIWILMNLEIWHRLFLESDSVPGVQQWVSSRLEGSHVA